MAPRPERAPATQGGRAVPGYKRMPHTGFTVDAFRYGLVDGCTGYFLTHFHSDHYGGLTKGFAGDIFCSRITARCVVGRIGVDPGRVHALPMNTRCVVQGVFVTLLDANHCPGAAVILFEVPRDGRLVRIVHTGDFRATPELVDQILRVFAVDTAHPVTPETVAAAGAGCEGHTSPLIDYIYLDTTYLQPVYSFPRQSQVVQAVAEFSHCVHSDQAYLPAFLLRTARGGWSSRQSTPDRASPGPTEPLRPAATPSLITRWFQPRKRIAGGSSSSSDLWRRGRRVLFAVGSYTLGKERLFVEIALRLRSRVYVTEEKRRILGCIASPSLLALLTDDMAEAQVHVVSMAQVNMQKMGEYLAAVRRSGGAGFSSVVAFKPTGWAQAGRGFAWREQPPLEYPPELSQARLDLACDGKGPDAAAAALALEARLGSSGGCAFGIDSLRAHGSSPTVAIFPVPYSEHSSFSELAEFVCSLRAGQVVPTVPASDDKDRLADSWLRHWQRLGAEFERRAAPAPAGQYPALGLHVRALQHAA
ncbi:repair protein PSO2 SNM1 [Coemansia javaensis]|uniref:Repair protein PSO2 SNM1 n=1 Tax=Coemansia javaensis TaxID=2761396 RepID=A0A9W8HIJ3_9FUNG|nr:repair protein PSO2 SNM1 [Coemansia javaensis]